MGIFDKQPDRTWRNNDSDNKLFYGYDNSDGTTAWYDTNNNLDSIGPTPSDDEQYQNDEGY